jgi:hypothetical protein
MWSRVDYKQDTDGSRSGQMEVFKHYPSARLKGPRSSSKPGPESIIKQRKSEVYSSNVIFRPLLG